MHTRKGGIFPSQSTVSHVAFDGKEFLLCRGRDLREPKPPADAIARTDRSTLDSSVDAIFVLHDGKIVECQPPANAGSLQERIREDLATMLLESGTIRERMARALRGEEVTFNWYSQRPDTSRANIECTLSRIDIEGSIRLLAVALDITARRKSARTLAQLSGRLLELQDEERRRIARELHDTTGQNLGALRMGLSMILSAQGIESHTQTALEESIALADVCIREIRTMS